MNTVEVTAEVVAVGVTPTVTGVETVEGVADGVNVAVGCSACATISGSGTTDAISAGSRRALARGSGARVELYHALTETIVVPRPLVSRPGPSLDDIFDGVARKAASRGGP